MPTTRTARPSRMELVFLCLIMSTALLLRMGWPGNSSFAFDEARVSQLALEMARNGVFAKVGMPSSTGLPNFPATVWLFSIPFAISTNPLLAILSVGLLNTLGALALWWLVRKTVSPKAALISSALMASSPFLVFYSRGIWSQDLLAPLAVFWALFAMIGIADRRDWALAFFVFLTGFVPQVHYAGLALLLPAGWLFIRFRLWKRWLPLTIGFAAACAVAAPFLITILQTPALREGFAHMTGQTTSTDLEGLVLLANMAVGRSWKGFLLGLDWTWPSSIETSILVSYILLGITEALGLAMVIRKAWRTRHESTPQAVISALIPVWLLSAPLIFARHSTPVYHQYQLAALPAAFTACGYAVELVKQRWFRASLLIIALLCAGLQTGLTGHSLQMVSQELTPGGIGTPLLYPQAAAQALQDGGEVIVHAHGDASEFVGDVAGFEVLLWDYPHRMADGQSVLLIPQAADAHLLFTFESLAAYQQAQLLDNTLTPTNYPRRIGEPPYVALSGVDILPKAYTQVEPIALANGAVLHGYRLDIIEEKLRVTTIWRIENEPDNTRYHQFHHLKATPDVAMIEGHDVPVSSAAWRQGDTLVVWADMALPETSEFYVDLGMYQWPEMLRSGRQDSQDPGQPITLGPLALPE